MYGLGFMVLGFLVLRFFGLNHKWLGLPKKEAEPLKPNFPALLTPLPSFFFKNLWFFKKQPAFSLTPNPCPHPSLFFKTLP
jgi:hypothetical protein